MSKLLGRNLWICMLAMTAVACGGGGGDNNEAAVDPNAPDAVAQRLTVTNPNTQVVTGTAPKSTASDEAPEVTSAGDALRTADAGDEVTIDLSISSLNGVSSLLARVTAATSYVEVADPDVTPTGGTAKALGGSSFSGTLTLQLSSQLTADQFCFEIAAVDELGQVSNYRKVCFDIPNNRPATAAAKPRVNAGGDQTVADKTSAEATTVTLSGTAQRSGGSISSYQWTQVGGTPAVTFVAAAGAAAGAGPEVSFEAPDVDGNQTFKFQLEVTADDGQKVRDTTEVTIIDTDVNTAPTVRAGNDLSVNEGATVNLRGFASDTDGTIANLLWAPSNNAVQLSSTSTRSTSFVAPAVGRNGTSVTLTLTATDDDGATGSDSLTVTIANVNNVPVASDGSLSTLKNEPVEGNLRDYASDADGENITFTITDNVTSGTLTVAADDSFTYTPATDFTGSVSFTYQASDGLGSDTGTITILVQDQIGTNGGAGKGVISGGSISASEITSGGQVSRGTSTTATDGDYDLVLTGYSGGPLMISLNGGNGATMKCDVANGCNGVPFGGDVSLPDTFQMQVLLPEVASSADLASCISPFTHLAAQRAIEVAGSLDAVTTAIAREALSEVGSLLMGVDVLRTCVIDSTSTSAVRRASNKDLTLTALSAAVLSVQGATDPAAALANLAAQFTGGVITGGDLQALVTAASDELSALGEADRTGVLVAMAEAASDAGAAGTFDPVANPAAGGSAVEQGKALVASIRNLGYAIIDDGEGYDSTNASHPANLFHNRIVAANDELLFEAVNASLTQAFLAAEAFYLGDRNPVVAEGTPGTTTLTTQDSGGTDQSATITVTNESNGDHKVTVVGQVGDVIIDWAVRSPVDEGTPGNRPSGNLTGTLTATAQTAATAAAGFSLEVTGTIGVTGLSIAQRTLSTDAVPSGTITVDGSRADWTGLATFTDPQGDQEGVSAADIVEYSMSLDTTNQRASLLSVMASDVAFPHTPGAYSEYSMGIGLFRDTGCRDYGGEIYATIQTTANGSSDFEILYISSDTFEGAGPIDVDAQGRVIEFGFSSGYFDGYESVTLEPFNLAHGDDVDNNDDPENPERLDVDNCFNLNGAGTHQEEVYRGGDIAFDLDFTFRQTDETDPLIMEGDLSFAFSNCANCDQVAGNELINFGHFRVDAELYDQSRNNGAGFFFEVDFDDTAEDNFNPLMEIGPDNVPAASFTLAFDAALAGLEYDLVIAGDFRDITGTSVDPFSGGEFTEVDADITVRVGRDGRYMEFIANPPTVVDNGVEATASFGNQDGVVLRFELRETPGSEVVSGEVYVGSTKVGDLEQTDNGLVLIRWIDGSFESLG